MSGSNDIPSLADLRRGRGGRRAPVRPPSLFDFAVEEVVAESASAPEIAAVTNAEVIAELERNEVSGIPGGGVPRIRLAESTVQAKVWSVRDLVRSVRTLVERGFAGVAVEGEISNWRPAASGHCYFTLKDGEAQLSVVMFRRQASLLRFAPKDGDAVRLRGQVSLYESRGQLQLVAETMEQMGMGALLAVVRELKERLRREGLFDRKRTLPAFPRCIGVVTSVQGAALRDIVKVCRRRHASVKLLVYPAAVQGPNCAREVAAGVRWFSERPELVDVVMVARGGGSWEDLHGFDDEGVARAIAGCSVPVIVGVGHATDTTIADAAADVCAPTPSAAAELVTAGQHSVEERLERLSARVRRAGEYEVLRARQRLSRLSADVVLRKVRDALERRAQRVDELEYRAESAVQRGLQVREARLARLTVRLQAQHVSNRMAANRRRLEQLQLRLRDAGAASMLAKQTRLERASLRLEGLSPLRVLERGYALVYGMDGTLLKSVNGVILGGRITARLADGSLNATVYGKK